jgi:hypothetical protein
MFRARLFLAAGLACLLAGCSAAPSKAPLDMPQGTAPSASGRALEAGRAGGEPGSAMPGGFGTGGWGGPQTPGGPAPPQLTPPSVTRAPRP